MKKCSIRATSCGYEKSIADFGAPINIDKSNLLAVVIPQALIDAYNKAIFDTIDKVWQTSIISYISGYMRPESYISTIMDKVRDFLMKKGLL